MSSAGFDLVIRGGTVVTPERAGSFDIGVRAGRIAQLGGNMAAELELDAGDLIVIPGGIDAHVHLLPAALAEEHGRRKPVRTDDFWTGSLAAIAGGITTIGNMTFPGDGQSMTDAVSRDMNAARDEAGVDWFVHPVLADPADDSAAEITALASEGHRSVKVFLSDARVAARGPELAAAFEAAGRAGSITLVHCEDAAQLERAGQELIKSGRGGVRYFPDARPVAAEVAATEQAISIGRAASAPVYLVHLSSSGALDSARRARVSGQQVYVETRPLYLHLTRERFDEPDAGKYVGAPPLREQRDRDALWRGLADGDIDTVCSDHAPWTLEAKLDPALNVMTARQGVADLETLMPMLYSEGVAGGRISLRRFVELTSGSAARLFGLYPRKGAIAVGSDADLVLWDPAERRIVDGASMRSRAGYSVYDGWEVQGWPRIVISRGQVVLAGGSITARPGQGQWVHRGPLGAARAG